MADRRTACVLARIDSYRGEQISRKIVSRELGPRSYRDFAKNIALLGAKKWGTTCDRDISNSAIYATVIYRAYTVYDSEAISSHNWGLEIILHYTITHYTTIP